MVLEQFCCVFRNCFMISNVRTSFLRKPKSRPSGKLTRKADTSFEGYLLKEKNTRKDGVMIFHCSFRDQHAAEPSSIDPQEEPSEPPELIPILPLQKFSRFSQAENSAKGQEDHRCTSQQRNDELVAISGLPLSGCWTTLTIINSDCNVFFPS